MTRPTHSNLYLYIHFLFDFFIYFNISTSLLVSWWLILRILIPTHYKKFLDPHMISIFFPLSLDPRPDIPCPINSYLTINPPLSPYPFWPYVSPHSLSPYLLWPSVSPPLLSFPPPLFLPRASSSSPLPQPAFVYLHQLWLQLKFSPTRDITF